MNRASWQQTNVLSTLVPRNQAVTASTFAACESTGFEAAEGSCGWELGWICGSTFTACGGPPNPDNTCTGDVLVDKDCCATNPNPLNGWYLSGTNQHCTEPHVSTANPQSGAQHLRFERSEVGGVPAGCTGLGGACRINAITPIVGSAPLTVITTIEMDVALGLAAGSPPPGSSLLYSTISDNHSAHRAVQLQFRDDGMILAYDPGINNYVPIGQLDGDGAYNNIRVDYNPCDGIVDYYVDKMFAYYTPVANYEAQLSRGVFEYDNVGGHWDVDNYSVFRHSPCSPLCGDFIAVTFEECDIDDDEACPGRCVPPGSLDECTCLRPCSDCGAPCPVINGMNGPYLTDGGLYSYTADSPFTSIDTCDPSTDYDTVIFWNLFANCTDQELVNDECNELGALLGQDAGDPSASCYVNTGGGPPFQASDFPMKSCLCAETTPGQAYAFAITEYGGTEPALGSSHTINIRKKTACGSPILGGACCDGLTGVCEDGVSAMECSGGFDTYHEGKLCTTMGITCEAILGACCDRSPGAGGACSDTTLANCSATWTLGVSCSTLQPQCAEVQGACCNALLGSCSVTLQAACNCADCSWTEGATCGSILCNPIQGACCELAEHTAECTQTSQADCNCENCTWTRETDCGDVTCDPLFTTIPTASAWGLAALALVLLIAAKVAFRRTALG